ncbi:hypothetical protein V0288_14185 [Pannus brasiliensis CCIBt3594]|uniref:DUF104 domain-containing protein n=1 Tax=Pannus brasiliensis CCIBt3594 TaxID=1427578 RepID=A0AAW9QTA7_9CHRO
MTKSTLYATAKVLPGNKIEIQSPDLPVGQTVEVVILMRDAIPDSANEEDRSPSLEERIAFLKLPLTERRRILESQAGEMLDHYQQDLQWRELMAGDIIDY